MCRTLLLFKKHLPVGPITYAVEAHLPGWSLQVFAHFSTNLAFLSCSPSQPYTHPGLQPRRNTSGLVCGWPSPCISSCGFLSFTLVKGFGGLGYSDRVGTFTAGQMGVPASFWRLPHLEFPFQLGPFFQPKEVSSPSLNTHSAWFLLPLALATFCVALEASRVCFWSCRGHEVLRLSPDLTEPCRLHCHLIGVGQWYGMLSPNNKICR